jgi:ABC-2 type transport system permease protein
MRGQIQHFAHEFRAGVRNPTQLMLNYLFPLGFYLMMGFVMTGINPEFANTMTPAMAIFVIMVAAVLGLPGPIAEAREAGIYRSFRTIGVPAASVLAMPALTTALHALAMATLVSLASPRFFGAAAPEAWAPFAGIVLLTAFCFVAIGLLIGVVAKDSRAVTLMSQVIFLPSMLLGGLMVPLSLLPESMRTVAALLPTTHAMQAIEGLAFGRETIINPTLAAGALGITGALAVVLAGVLFRWDTRAESGARRPILALLALAPLALVAVLG